MSVTARPQDGLPGLTRRATENVCFKQVFVQMKRVMAQSETVERILDAAEQLFAEKGFAETSLRLITSKAGVNLAAVNYHFGSKKALIQAVFSRFLGPFCVSLERELDRRQAKPETKVSLEELLELLVEQALAVKPRSGNDLSIFMRLLGLAFSQSQGHLRKVPRRGLRKSVPSLYAAGA